LSGKEELCLTGTKPDAGASKRERQETEEVTFIAAGCVAIAMDLSAKSCYYTGTLYTSYFNTFRELNDFTARVATLVPFGSSLNKIMPLMFSKTNIFGGVKFQKLKENDCC
jgi:hypothetical protein